MFLKREFLLIIFLGFLISSITSFLYLNKYDQINNHNVMIRGDIHFIWKEAEILKKDLHNGKNFFSSGTEYRRTYLPSKLLAIYSYLTGYELFENFDEGKIKQGYGQLFYLIIQSLIYYLSLLFFYFKILIFFNFNKQKCFFILCFLALEPTIIQWHSSFWTESIFFSLQLISLGLIIKKKKNIFHYLITGIFIGLLYLQKTTAMFYIFPVILYFAISIKNKRTVSIVSFVFGYLFVILFLGYHNFKRSNIFYVIPKQSKVSHYHYLVPQVISIKNNISESEIRRGQKKSELKWIIENNINLNSEKDRRQIYNYYQKYAFEVFLHNPLITAKIYIKKTIHHGLLNPVQIYFWYKYNNNDNGEQYHLNSDHKKWIWKRILYSLVIYFFILIGIFYSFKKREHKNFNYFIILSIFYYMFMLGWMGNTRYFMPSLILLSIFFGEGMFLVFQRFLRKNII
jgi:hypothetical protein